MDFEEILLSIVWVKIKISMVRRVSECKENNIERDMWLKGFSFWGNEYGLIVFCNVMFSYSSLGI